MKWSESDFLFLSLCAILILYAMEPDLKGLIQMAAADFQKLIENMKRANGIAARAANDAAKHSSIMDSFEQRLNLNHENMSKIAEYEKMMADMDQAMGNGGPALDATFSASGTNPPSSGTHQGPGNFDVTSGKQL